MSDQAYAGLLGSLDECLRTGGEAFEAEVEGGNHPVATGGWDSAVYTAKLNSAQEGGGLDHSKLKHTVTERDIDIEGTMAQSGRALRPARGGGDGSGRGAPAPGGRERAPHMARQGTRQVATSSRSVGARQGPRQAATSSRSAGERQTDKRLPFFVAFVPVASGLR